MGHCATMQAPHTAAALGVVNAVGALGVAGVGALGAVVAEDTSALGAGRRIASGCATTNAYRRTHFSPGATSALRAA